MKQINFNELAREFGADVPADPFGPGGPGGPKPGAPTASCGPLPGTPGNPRNTDFTMPETWNMERSLKMLDYFSDAAEKREPLEFFGHPACWAMMALMDKLKNNDVYLCMPPNNQDLKVEAYRIGDQPAEGQMATFEVEEKGNDVQLTAILTNGGNPDPFALPMHDTVAPAIPARKNIYVELYGAHYFAVFSLPLTYPDCNAMFMKMADATYCVKSSTPEYKVGQIVECPF